MTFSLSHKRMVEALRTIGHVDSGTSPLSDLELKCLVWFFHYSYNVLSQAGRLWKGVVFRQHETKCTMCLKTEWEGVPQVAFVTGRTPTDCMRILCRKWYQETLEWFPDKYP